MYFMVLCKEKMRSPSGYLKYLEIGLNGFIFIVGIFLLVAGCGKLKSI